MIESVRSLLREERFQAGYIEDKYQVYVMLVRLLLQSGQLAEAFNFAERLRARSYADLVRKGRPRAQAAAEIELREKIRQLQKALERENNRPHDERRAQDAESYSRELADAERTYQNLLDDLRASDPEYAEAGSMKVPELAKVQARLDSGTALIEYVVGQEHVLAFGLTAKQIRAHVIPLSSTNLTARIELLRELIARRSGDEWRDPAASLARSLILPLERQGWLAGISRLYVVPHQSLHYLPFTVLPRGTRTLGEDCAIAYLPAAAVLVHASVSANTSKRLLAMAPGRPGLKHVEEEARAVREFFPSGSRVLTGVRASESAFKSLAPTFGILHVATHASFNQLNPMFSALDLEPAGTEDGKLQVHEILELRLNASLVTLSACDTAMASGHFAEVPTGDGFVGLTRAFLYAGSRSVLATLWEVDDRSTPAFMRSFYSRIEKSNKAASLSAAQRELRGNAQYQHPYYWAAFILVGKME
jgi:CHAT domain-containing protein